MYERSACVLIGHVQRSTICHDLPGLFSQCGGERGHDGRGETEELYIFLWGRQTTKGKHMDPSARVGTSCCSRTIVLSVFREREEIAHALVSSYISRSADDDDDEHRVLVFLFGLRAKKVY